MSSCSHQAVCGTLRGLAGPPAARSPAELCKLACTRARRGRERGREAPPAPERVPKGSWKRRCLSWNLKARTSPQVHQAGQPAPSPLRARHCCQLLLPHLLSHPHSAPSAPSATSWLHTAAIPRAGGILGGSFPGAAQARAQQESPAPLWGSCVLQPALELPQSPWSPHASPVVPPRPRQHPGVRPFPTSSSASAFEHLRPQVTHPSSLRANISPSVPVFTLDK